MSSVMLGDAVAVASATALLVIIIASLVLLAIRAWSGTTGLVLTRRVSLLLNGSIVVLIVVFLLLVFVRFKTVV